jgi:Domain of unknown function (DUF4214)
MRGLQFSLGTCVCVVLGIANAAGTLKTYTAEAAFAGDDAIDWSVAGASDSPRSLSGTAARGTVAATATVRSGNLERVPTASRHADDRPVTATLFRADGNSGPVTVTFGSGPLMGVGVRFEGGTGRIAGLDSHGNVLAGVTAGATGFVGIRSSVKEIAALVIDSPAAAYTVNIALGPVTASDVFFVNQLFQDLYGRMPAASEIEDRVDAIRNGSVTRAQMAAGMLTSGDFHEMGGYLARCFLALVRHDADFPRWFQIYNLMRRGASQEAVLAAFLATPELSAAYPADLPEAAFIAKVHQDILGRQPESSELETWTSQMANGGTRAEVVNIFLQSPEVEGRLAARININLCFLALLRHEASPEAAEQWMAALDNGAPLTNLIGSILSSLEYAARF